LGGGIDRNEDIEQTSITYRIPPGEENRERKERDIRKRKRRKKRREKNEDGRKGSGVKNSRGEGEI